MRSRVDRRNVAGLKSVAADGDDFVVVVEVGLGQIEHEFGFQRLHKRRAQSEDQVAVQVFMLRLP